MENNTGKVSFRVAVMIIPLFIMAVIFFPKRSDKYTINLPVKETSLNLQKIYEFTLDETDYKIGRIGYGNYIGDNYIYIIDRANWTCLKYDHSGQFSGSIGKQGRGPGEYTEPSSIFADEEKDRIFVFDVSKFSLICYNSNNQFQFEKTFQKGHPYPGELQRINNGYLITYFQFQGTNRWENIQYFHFLNEKMDIRDEWQISFPSSYKKFNWINLSSIFWNFDTTHNKLYVAFYAVPEIHVYSNAQLTDIWKLSLKNFKPIDRQVTVQNLLQKIKIFSQYSYIDGLYRLDNERLLVTYHNENLPEIGKFKIFESRKYRKYYFALINPQKKLVYMPRNNQLPGYPFGTHKGKLFILEKNKPNERIIGAYEIQNSI